jgi:hypothetical protein
VKGDRVPSDCSLALHCQPSVFLERDRLGNLTGVNVDALRVDDDGISTNWIEYDGGNFESACLILADLRTVRSSHRVGVMSVKAIEEIGEQSDVALHAAHDPITLPEPNPAHALIIGVTPKDSELLLALTTIVSLRPFALPGQ